MKKSILLTCAIVVVLSLIIGDRFLLKLDSEENSGQVQMAAENNAAAPGLITIEDGPVPLAATIPGTDTQSESVEVTATEASDDGVEVPSCLIGGAHNNVWTDCGDYKVMQCAGCGQEVGTRATDLGGGVYGYYDDAAAALLLKRANKIRLGCELGEKLNEIAKSRALACVNNFSHDDMQTDGECIAKGQADADAVIAAWNASDHHRRLLIDPVYIDGGSACLWYDAGNGNMTSVWVLVME